MEITKEYCKMIKEVEGIKPENELISIPGKTNMFDFFNNFSNFISIEECEIYVDTYGIVITDNMRKVLKNFVSLPDETKKYRLAVMKNKCGLV